MVKKRISFDIDVPKGYTASVKKKRRKSSSKGKRSIKAVTSVKIAKEDSSIRVVRPLEVMMPVNKRMKRAKPKRRKRLVKAVRPIKFVMPKPKKKRSVKKTIVRSEEYSLYKKKFLGLVMNFIDAEFGVIVKGVKEFISTKRKFKALTWYLAFLVAGITVILLGIVKYIECLCPDLECGLVYIIIGLIAIFIGMICNKLFS